MLDSVSRLNRIDLQILWDVYYVREYKDAWLIEILLDKVSYVPFKYKDKPISINVLYRRNRFIY